jgi:peptidyl-prolyl cis-trans isomerase D
MAIGKGGGKTAVWILMGLLILGLGGFGATSFSSTVRSIGSVGDRDIGTAEYGRALQNELRALEAQTGQAFSFEQAQALGIDRQVLNRLITDAAIDDEAARIGLSVGDTTVAKQLQDIPAFQGIDGQFDRESYRFALDRIGVSEAEFERSIRRETSRALLQGAVVTGPGLPGQYVDQVMSYYAERRRVTWARVEGGQLTSDMLEPSEEELMALYEEQIEEFTRPELKRITYAWLTPEMILDTVEVDETLLREAYNQRLDEYVRPERRLVERLIFADDASASQARTSMDDGSQSFEDLVEGRGLKLEDVDMGDVTLTDLGDAGEAVFAAQSGDVVGPLPTSLGPAFFRVNGILAAEETTFEEAKPDLRDDLALDRARRLVTNEAEPAEDLLASGATLEDLTNDSDMQLGTIDWAPGLGEGIAAYDGFDVAAEALSEDDYPEIMFLGDGSIYAMRLEGITPPEPTPFENVRDRVRAIWETRNQMDRLRAQAADYVAKMGDAADFTSLGLEVRSEENLTRQGTVLGAPENFAQRAFAMEPGEIATLDGFGAVVILKLEEILPPDLNNADVQAMRGSLAQQLQGSLSNDIYRAVAEDIRQRAGIELNQQAITAVHSNFQ